MLAEAALGGMVAEAEDSILADTLGLRGKAGGCARVTAGPKRPLLAEAALGGMVAEAEDSILADTGGLQPP